MRPIILRILLMDGKAKAIDFDSSANSKELAATLASKLGLTEKSGFAIFEKVDPTFDAFLAPSVLLGDLLYKWEARGMLLLLLFVLLLLVITAFCYFDCTLYLLL